MEDIANVTSLSANNIVASDVYVIVLKGTNLYKMSVEELSILLNKSE